MRECYRLTFVLGDMKRLGPQQLEVLLRTLVSINVIRLQASGFGLRSGPEARSLMPAAFSSWPTGQKPEGHEEWQDAASVLLTGRGNLPSLACLRAAELRLRGVGAQALPEIRSGRWRPRIYTPDGGYSDLVPGNAGWRTLEDRERITFCLDLFNGASVSESVTQATLDTLLLGLQEIQQNCLIAHPEIPPLYSLGDRLLYMEEPPGQEDWQCVLTCLRMGLFDCEEGGTWRAAESVVRQGIPARAISSKHTIPGGGTLYHIKTKFADGHEEDPSKVMGMR